MENDGVSSGSKRIGSATRVERSASSCQGYFASKRENDWDGSAPKCYCRHHAILYLSKTSSNPNRLFFGCPMFMIGALHCSFFLWLDRHVAKFNRTGVVNCAEVEEVAIEHSERFKVIKRLGELEDKVAAIEEKGINKFRIVMGLLVVAISNWVGKF